MPSYIYQCGFLTFISDLPCDMNDACSCFLIRNHASLLSFTPTQPKTISLNITVVSWYFIHISFEFHKYCMILLSFVLTLFLSLFPFHFLHTANQVRVCINNDLLPDHLFWCFHVVEWESIGHRGGCYPPGLLQGCTKALQCAHGTTVKKPWMHEGYGAHVRCTSRGCCCCVPKHALFRPEKAFGRFWLPESSELINYLNNVRYTWPKWSIEKNGEGMSLLHLKKWK